MNENNLKLISKLLISLSRDNYHKEEILLSYMMEFQNNGVYKCLRGTKLICLERTGLTKKQYQDSVKYLLELGLINKNKLYNSNSTYNLYEFNSDIKKILSDSKNLEFFIKKKIKN